MLKPILIVLESCSWTEWLDKDDPTGYGDWEVFDCCDAEKYEFSLVSGGPVYTNVSMAPQNLKKGKMQSGLGSSIWCSNDKQQNSNITRCEALPCPCHDYKARFCCRN